MIDSESLVILEIPMKTSEILKKAASLLQKHGWCRNTQQDEEGRMCAAGAIQKVVAGEPHHWDYGDGSPQQLAMKAVGKVLKIGAKDPTLSVVHWNNYTCKDKAEIVRVFRAAAKLRV